ncbi:hypothetical protein KCV06_g88, partial [Aureobasidium melanogenum]
LQSILPLQERKNITVPLHPKIEPRTSRTAILGLSGERKVNESVVKLKSAFKVNGVKSIARVFLYAWALSGSTRNPLVIPFASFTVLPKRDKSRELCHSLLLTSCHSAVASELLTVSVIEVMLPSPNPNISSSLPIPGCAKSGSPLRAGSVKNLFEKGSFVDSQMAPLALSCRSSFQKHVHTATEKAGEPGSRKPSSLSNSRSRPSRGLVRSCILPNILCYMGLEPKLQVRVQQRRDQSGCLFKSDDWVRLVKMWDLISSGSDSNPILEVSDMMLRAA